MPDDKLSERIFRLAVEAAPSGMIVVDGADIIALVNGEIERQFGYSRTELIGQSVDILIPIRHLGAARQTGRDPVLQRSLLIFRQAACAAFMTEAA